jgi:hypothetical protein
MKKRPDKPPLAESELALETVPCDLCGGTETRERYRKRFGIESSFRQLRQARIYTCTRNPRLRLVFIAVALIADDQLNACADVDQALTKSSAER